MKRASVRHLTPRAAFSFAAAWKWESRLLWHSNSALSRQVLLVLLDCGSLKTHLRNEGTRDNIGGVTTKCGSDAHPIR